VERCDQHGLPRDVCGTDENEHRTMCALSPVVHARSLAKRYGETQAVRGIDFSIWPSECFGFLGVNGAGKTTTMKMIYCRIARTSGELLVLGLDPAKDAVEIKQRLGVVAQENELDPELSVLENLLLYASFFGIGGAKARTRARELLELMSLSGKERAQVREISGGMKRRLVIARALVNDPEILVLDEPTTGLDPQARLLVWEKLGALREAGLTLLLTSHYMEEAARLCNRVAIIDEGRILALRAPDELIAQFAASDVLELIDAEDAGALHEQLDGLVMRRERHGDTQYLFCADNRVLLEKLRELGHDPLRHVARRATLEDVFLNITGRELVD
jgi:lipooligosaccharide transport system ATP-binding protein